MSNNILKIDFGSGYNPKSGYKMCDITNAPFLDFVYDGNEIVGCKKHSVAEFYLRNVVHHIKNLEEVFSMLHSYLKRNGTIKIIDVRKDYYKQNVILDIIWYRYVIPRKEIWFSTVYRNYFEILRQLGFQLEEQYYQEEKEVSLWRKL